MLDLWLSAKSKLREGGNRFPARTCSPPFPSQCAVHRNSAHDTRLAPQLVLSLPRPPSGSSSSSPAGVKAEIFFQTPGWWVTMQERSPWVGSFQFYEEELTFPEDIMVSGLSPSSFWG